MLRPQLAYGQPRGLLLAASLRRRLREAHTRDDELCARRRQCGPCLRGGVPGLVRTFGRTLPRLDLSRQRLELPHRRLGRQRLLCLTRRRVALLAQSTLETALRLKELAARLLG